MPYEVVMPQLGLTMTEGSVSCWLKQRGDRIEKGETLFEVQTDKAEMEVESPASGFVEAILVEPNKVVPVGTLIARISETEPSATAGDSAGSPEAAEPSVAPPVEPVAPAPEAAPAVVEREEAAPRKLASPRAKRLAQEFGVDLARVEPSPGRSRVTEEDVRQYCQRAGVQPAGSGAGEVPETPSTVRKAIAARMTCSVQTIPHFDLTALADASELAKLRESLLPVVQGVRLTYTDFLIKAFALAVKENPGVNVSWRNDMIVRHAGIAIGLAVQVDDGLVVPVIRGADQLALPDLAKLRASMVEKARAGKLTLAEMEGASCTLSNLGNLGVDQFRAIINPPESAILAVGKMASRPVVAEGQVVARLTVPLTLSLDHRVIDGAPGAEFLRSIVTAIESPYRLLLESR